MCWITFGLIFCPSSHDWFLLWVSICNKSLLKDVWQQPNCLMCSTFKIKVSDKIIACSSVSISILKCIASIQISWLLQVENDMALGQCKKLSQIQVFQSIKLQWSWLAHTHSCRKCTCLKSSFLWERDGRWQKQEVGAHWLVSHWLPRMYFNFLLLYMHFSFPPALEHEKERAKTQLLGERILVWIRRPRQTAEHSAFHRSAESPYHLREAHRRTNLWVMS